MQSDEQSEAEKEGEMCDRRKGDGQHGSSR